MNEDERGITPPDVTAMTMELRNGNWHVTIEQGNGDVIKEIELTIMERIQLAAMLAFDPCAGSATHIDFVDVYRSAGSQAPGRS